MILDMRVVSVWHNSANLKPVMSEMLEHKKKKKKQPRVAMLLRVPRGAQGDALEDQIVQI